MKRPHDPSDSLHTSHFETFEERLALSADPIADFRLLPGDEPVVADLPNWIELAVLAPTATTSSGNGWTDVNAVRNNYGLTGSKQTVAVIDSGIAYDHIALGGGYGRANRVVGGWDFAEGDADPYDDGPAGFHGTHVAGIIGANDKKYSGVASDVDLVALRVFDDQGNGYFTWVEQALRWVHTNQYAFDSPITTVNLSLGTEWNAATLPNWATLEDEFALLESAGIFISVAAGNSFKSYNQAGLSYPAASQYVVPVASVGKDGLLSGFSQRDARVLAAPGEKVTSTLPDHFYGGDGYKNDFGASSGTSMAAPYVAGASVLMREALIVMGQTNVTQDMIYDRLYASADIVYDSITGGNYRRVNLSRALEGVIGLDEFGSTAATAASLGSVLNVSGTINQLSDLDFFRYTADRTGTVTLVMQQGGNLVGKWSTAVAGAQIAGNKLTFSVIAGQSYTFGVGTTAGIGKYQVQSQFVAAVPVTPPPTTPTPPTQPPTTPTPPPTTPTPPPATPNPPSTPTPPAPPTPPPASNVPAGGNLGVVSSGAYNNLQISGERWLQVTAGRSGLLTVEALHNQAGGNIRLEIYNSQKLLLRSIDGVSGVERIDVNAGAGGVYLVRLVGTNSDVDLRITNLVTMNGRTATVNGSAANDTFVFDASGAQRQIVVNGTTYALGTASQINFNGNGGTDSVTLIGGAVADKATLRGGRALLTSSAYQVSVTAEYVTAKGGAGDIALMHEPVAGSQWGNDATGSWVVGGGAKNTVSGFSVIAKIPKATTFSPASVAAAPSYRSGLDSPAISGEEIADPTFAQYSLSGLRTESFTTGKNQSGLEANGDGPLNQNVHTVSSSVSVTDLFAVQNRGLAAAIQDSALVGAADESMVSLRCDEPIGGDLNALEAVFDSLGRTL